MKTKGYKLCKACDSPMLKKGQKRNHPYDYRHCAGCPLAPPAEQRRWYQPGGLFHHLPQLAPVNNLSGVTRMMKEKRGKCRKPV